MMLVDVVVTGVDDGTFGRRVLAVLYDWTVLAWTHTRVIDGELDVSARIDADDDADLFVLEAALNGIPGATSVEINGRLWGWQLTPHARQRTNEMQLTTAQVLAVAREPDYTRPHGGRTLAVGQGLVVVQAPGQVIVTVLWDGETSREAGMARSADHSADR
jgi:hypothetical protein